MSGCLDLYERERPVILELLDIMSDTNKILLDMKWIEAPLRLKPERFTGFLPKPRKWFKL